MRDKDECVENRRNNITKLQHNKKASNQMDWINVTAHFMCLNASATVSLHLVQNVAARLLTNTTPITSVLAYLRTRASSSCRIDFKKILTAFKAICGLAPSYIADLLPHIQH